MWIVGQEDCGHMRVDVELRAPFELLWNERAYILVSLPMVARWHTFDRFNAERILRQSGQFDYSEAQVLDMSIMSRRCDVRGPLNLCSCWCVCVCVNTRADSNREVAPSSKPVLSSTSRPHFPATCLPFMLPFMQIQWSCINTAGSSVFSSTQYQM